MFKKVESIYNDVKKMEFGSAKTIFQFTSVLETDKGHILFFGLAVIPVAPLSPIARAADITPPIKNSAVIFS